MPNQIMQIYPYRHRGQWVFDDPARDLLREPFIAGADAIIDAIVAEHAIVNADDGFTLTFSASPFPGFHAKLTRIREEMGGNVYAYKGMEGWLCPAMFKFFATAPNHIYASATDPQPRPSRKESR